MLASGVGQNALVGRRFHLTLPHHLGDEPVLYALGKRFEVVTNVRRASIEEAGAWVILEVSGPEAAVDAAVSWLSEQGVRVERMDED